MAPSSEDARQQERANRLYWESEESVNQIADDLDVSKGTLYTLIEPLPAGLPCPRCGAEMEYPNRTARDKGFLTCPACDLEEDVDEVREEWRGAARDGDGAVVVRPGESEGVRRPPAQVLSEAVSSNRMLLGTALLGAAAGLALALWARKK